MKKQNESNSCMTGCILYIAFTILITIVVIGIEFFDKEGEILNANDINTQTIRVLYPNIQSIIYPFGSGITGGILTFFVYYCLLILILFLCAQLLIKTTWVPNWLIKWGVLLPGLWISLVVTGNVIDFYIHNYKLDARCQIIMILYIIVCIMTYKKYRSYIESKKRCPKCHRLDATYYDEIPKSESTDFCSMHFSYVFGNIICKEKELCIKRKYYHQTTCRYCDYVEEYEAEHKDRFICPNCKTDEYLEKDTEYPKKERRGTDIYFSYNHTVRCTRCGNTVSWNGNYRIST